MFGPSHELPDASSLIIKEVSEFPIICHSPRHGVVSSPWFAQHNGITEPIHNKPESSKLGTICGTGESAQTNSSVIQRHVRRMHPYAGQNAPQSIMTLAKLAFASQLSQPALPRHQSPQHTLQ